MFRNRNRVSLFGALTAGMAAVASSGAMAAASYDTILDGLDAGDAVTAFIAAATILALAGFAKWLSKKIGKYFG